jgi:hypothetical protein
MATESWKEEEKDGEEIRVLPAMKFFTVERNKTIWYE